MTRFNEVCKNAGIKLTHQRMEIFKEVAGSKAHPDAESVFRGVHERMPTLSQDTVYRTLWLLKDLGLITTVGVSRERTRFDGNIHPHHHFVCSRCGSTYDFHSRELDELNLPDQIKDMGRADDFQVTVKGVCKDCSDS
ncbi:Fur family transcriptional regulator [Desulfospira joergensenii]|uniref:Fur family transcriptional regulator n=1 Tax=Desulfospira joergensenii TaxID=53329 RepID=UPI001FC9F611|nr:transcriptional repressor [Desulfospira joergensenii]